MNQPSQALVLDRLLTGPRLFGLWNLELGSTFLLIKDGYVHTITTDNGRPATKYAKRITDEKFEVVEGLPAAALADSPVGTIAVTLPGAFLPSTLNRVTLTEHDSSVLGELTWVEPTESFQFGGYEFSGEPQDLRAA